MEIQVKNCFGGNFLSPGGVEIGGSLGEVTKRSCQVSTFLQFFPLNTVFVLIPPPQYFTFLRNILKIFFHKFTSKFLPDFLQRCSGV